MMLFYNFFLVYIKMSENTDLSHCQRNRDLILNNKKDYYKNNKEKSKEQARDKQSLSEEGKNKKREYGKNRYPHMPEEKKD